MDVYTYRYKYTYTYIYGKWCGIYTYGSNLNSTFIIKCIIKESFWFKEKHHAYRHGCWMLWAVTTGESHYSAKNIRAFPKALVRPWSLPGPELFRLHGMKSHLSCFAAFQREVNPFPESSEPGSLTHVWLSGRVLTKDLGPALCYLI